MMEGYEMENAIAREKPNSKRKDLFLSAGSVGLHGVTSSQPTGTKDSRSRMRGKKEKHQSSGRNTKYEIRNTVKVTYDYVLRSGKQRVLPETQTQSGCGKRSPNDLGWATIMSTVPVPTTGRFAYHSLAGGWEGWRSWLPSP